MIPNVLPLLFFMKLTGKFAFQGAIGAFSQLKPFGERKGLEISQVIPEAFYPFASRDK